MIVEQSLNFLNTSRVQMSLISAIFVQKLTTQQNSPYSYKALPSCFVFCCIETLDSSAILGGRVTTDAITWPVVELVLVQMRIQDADTL